MFKEFKNFLFRGNLLDLAVAVILALAFGAVVASLVADVITPLIAAAGGQPNFSEMVIRVGDGVVTYGNFLNALFSFVIVAFVMFLIMKAATRAQKSPATTDEPSDEAVLLAEIRDLLRTGSR